MQPRAEILGRSQLIAISLRCKRSLGSLGAQVGCGPWGLSLNDRWLRCPSVSQSLRHHAWPDDGLSGAQPLQPKYCTCGKALNNSASTTSCHPSHRVSSVRRLLAFPLNPVNEWHGHGEMNSCAQPCPGSVTSVRNLQAASFQVRASTTLFTGTVFNGLVSRPYFRDF